MAARRPGGRLCDREACHRCHLNLLMERKLGFCRRWDPSKACFPSVESAPLSPPFTGSPMLSRVPRKHGPFVSSLGSTINFARCPDELALCHEWASNGQAAEGDPDRDPSLSGCWPRAIPERSWDQKHFQKHSKVAARTISLWGRASSKAERKHRTQNRKAERKLAVSFITHSKLCCVAPRPLLLLL